MAFREFMEGRVEMLDMAVTVVQQEVVVAEFKVMHPAVAQTMVFMVMQGVAQQTGLDTSVAIYMQVMPALELRHFL